MLEILPVLRCVSCCLDLTTFRQLCILVLAMFSMTGRVTMLGISRWAGKGGSYRTIQRFFATAIDWGQLNWTLLRCQIFEPDEVVLVTGDESTVTKSGTKTHGLDTFFSSIVGKPVKGIAVFTWSLTSVKQRRSFPLLSHQVIKDSSDSDEGQQADVDTSTSKDNSMSKSTSTSKSTSKDARTRTSKKNRAKKTQGRPRGSKNHNRENVELSPYLQTLQTQLLAVKDLVGSRLSLTYVVLDGAFGNNYALQMVRRCGMHIISKLRADSALYFPYTGTYSGHGPRKKYGEKLTIGNLPKTSLTQQTTTGSSQTSVYQMHLWHKSFPQLLNVVILVKEHLKTGKRAHVLLVSSDRTLSAEHIIEYYRLRFQIEFNFRDAKQFWGLEDFMNIREQQVTTAMNLSFFLVNVSQILVRRFRHTAPAFSVNDLKAHFRGVKYVNVVLELLPEKPDTIVMQQIAAEVGKLGSINAA
jgi:putative transposase